MVFSTVETSDTKLFRAFFLHKHIQKRNYTSNEQNINKQRIRCILLNIEHNNLHLMQNRISHDLYGFVFTVKDM